MVGITRRKDLQHLLFLLLTPAAFAVVSLLAMNHGESWNHGPNSALLVDAPLPAAPSQDVAQESSLSLWDSTVRARIRRWTSCVETSRLALLLGIAIND